MSRVLTELVDELNRGTLKVVDLTQPLGPSTPVIGLPPTFAPSPGVTIDVISKYDDKGPAWYWNTIRMGEHTGTHFDAPVHWISGKDLPNNACDTIPATRFIGPACVIDVTSDVARDPDFLLTVERLEAGKPITDESRPVHGSCCALAGACGPTPRRSSTSATTVRTVRALTANVEGARRGPRRARRRRRNDRNRRRSSRHIQSAVSQPPNDARRRQVRAGKLVQPRSAAADGCSPDCGAAQDCQRQR